MKTVFILQNQNKQFLSKQNEWVDGRDANTLYRSLHKDEAINQMFEASAKDYTQRVRVLECPLNDRNLPVIVAEDLPSLTGQEAPSADEEPARTQDDAPAANDDEQGSGADSAKNEETTTRMAGA